jgi:hypothetical protein
MLFIKKFSGQNKQKVAEKFLVTDKKEQQNLTRRSNF